MKLRLNRHLVSNNAGSVLVMSVVISIAIVLLGTAYLKYIAYYQDRSYADVHRAQALHAAYAGTQYGLKMNDALVPEFEDSKRLLFKDSYAVAKCNYELIPTAVESLGFSETSTYVIVGKSYIQGAEFEGVFTEQVRQDESAFSYADWLYITDRETQEYRPIGEDTLRFWGPDTLDGKVHSNDKLHFQEGNDLWPVFFEFVTSCSTRFSPVNAPQFVEFWKGYRLSYNHFYFPIQADSVRAYGYYYNGEQLGSPTKVTELTLQPGYFLYRQRPNSGNNANRRYRGPYTSPPTPFNFDEGDIAEMDGNELYQNPYPVHGALFIEGEVWITAAKGKLHYNQSGGNDSLLLRGFSGQLTIAASGDIIIPQDIVYASSNADGSIPSTSQDVLGLISEQHILVWRHAPQYIRIQAALGAIGYNVADSLEAKRCANLTMPPDGINGTISVDGINCYNETNEKQQVEIRGCLIQRERGLIHTHYAPPGQPNYDRGFISKKYRYDWRFRYNPPPHFFKTKAQPDLFYAPLDNVFGIF